MLILVPDSLVFIYMLKFKRFLEKVKVLILQILTYLVNFLLGGATLSKKGATYLGSVLSLSLKYF